MKVLNNTSERIDILLPGGHKVTIQYNASDTDNPGLNIVLPQSLQVFPWEGNLEGIKGTQASQVWIDLPAVTAQPVHHVPTEGMTPEDAYVKYAREEIDLPQLLASVGGYIRNKQKTKVGARLGAMGRCYPWNRTVAKRLQRLGLDGVSFVQGKFIGTKESITHYWTKIGDYKVDITGNQFRHQTDQPVPPLVYVFMEDARYVEEEDVSDHLKLASPE